MKTSPCSIQVQIEKKKNHLENVDIFNIFAQMKYESLILWKQ